MTIYIRWVGLDILLIILLDEKFLSVELVVRSILERKASLKCDKSNQTYAWSQKNAIVLLY